MSIRRNQTVTNSVLCKSARGRQEAQEIFRPVRLDFSPAFSKWVLHGSSVGVSFPKDAAKTSTGRGTPPWLDCRFGKGSDDGGPNRDPLMGVLTELKAREPFSSMLRSRCQVGTQMYVREGFGIRTSERETEEDPEPNS